MSLKAFHIFFIAASTVLALGFGAWAAYVGVAQSATSFLVMGLCSIAVGGVLVYYGISVLQKLRDM